MADKQNEGTKAAEPLTVKMAFQPGPVVRTIGDVEWSAAAGWVQAVSVDLAADLLAYPHPGWSLGERPSAAVRKALADRLGVAPENIVAPGETIRFRPSLQAIVGAERAAQFVEAGVADTAALANLTEEEIAGLAFRTGATAAEIVTWVERAG